MKNKILFIGRFSPPMHGAAKMNDLYFKSESIQKNFDVDKVKINYFKSFEEMGKYNVSKFIGFFIVFFQLLQKLIFFKPNIIYFEIAPKGVAFYRDSIYAWVCKLFRKKILFVFHSRGVAAVTKNNLAKRYYAILLKNTKAIHLSKSLYHDIESVIDKKNVYFIGNGIIDELKDDEFKKITKQREENKKINLLFLSNMLETKGPLDVLEFCTLLKKNKIKFHCSFVGALKDKEFKAKWDLEKQKRKLGAECSFLGEKYKDEKKDIFSSSDFLILPTKDDAYPLVLIEAFMYGIPVLTYNTGAIKDMVTKNYLGTISYKRTSNDLYKLFLKFRKDINKGTSHKIRQHFKSVCTFAKSEKELKNIIIKEING